MWRADVQENQRLADAADVRMRGQVPAAASHPPSRERHGPSPAGGPDGKGPPAGGPGGPPPEGRRNRDGPGGAPAPGARPDTDALPQARLLRPEFAFAAPLAQGLLIQRMQATLIFASRDGRRQTLVPLQGDPVELEGGVRAIAQDVDGVLELWLQAADGFEARYRYLPEPAGGLRVAIEAGERDATSAYRVERVYLQPGGSAGG
ncbi:hypothetical protein LDO26_17475 [Luteimonas sp. BDR2-5]|uniref:hypothetical protein n=1 Tax=Proluteimonas luteida TaxID=2878685 RepID=UPI001E5F64B6|nr:hypothetical protein [Luteimonas sp. BDR2-5]MCD9029984.1 hypothetical protein [Luteimonas sp. BDR2-5]